MDWLLQKALDRFIRKGNLRLTTVGGRSLTFGDGTGTPVALRFTSKAAEAGILFDPELKFGEAYMEGHVVVDRGSIADVLAVLLDQTPDGKPAPWAKPQFVLRYLKRRWAQFNPPTRAIKNVSHHYDLDGGLYALFLDSDRQYSCAH